MTATATARFNAPQKERSLFPSDAVGEHNADHELEPASDTFSDTNRAVRAGFVLMPRAVLHASSLSRDARLLYAVLQSYAWQQASCFPSHQRLQADLGCGVNQVTKYLRELEAAGLVTRRRRGLGRSTVYTLHDPAPALATGRAQGDDPLARSGPQAAPPPRTHRNSDSGVTVSVSPESPKRRHEQDSQEYQAREQHHPLASPPTNDDEPIGARDDALLAPLKVHGITERIAVRLITTHDPQAIREQLEWHPYRPAAKNPAGSLVRAIQERWLAPTAWLAAQEHDAAVARQITAEATRQAEEAARRQEQEARPPEERIAGRLTFWVEGRRRKRQEPTPAEIAAKRRELLAQIVTDASSLSGH